MHNVTARIITDDCREALKSFQANSFDLIVTSPPYADQRKTTYGGIKAERYNAWFLERSAELLRVLKPTGTFILNIKEKVQDGERHTYVLELIMSLRQQGWLWTEEFIWHKRNCHPGKWPTRFRDAWGYPYNTVRKKVLTENQRRINTILTCARAKNVVYYGP